MFHFPSTLPQGSNSASGRSDGNSLNATQQKSATHPIFLQVEEELHDARRVHADGQEDDLRYALNMVINRVSDLSSMLSEAYKTQAELEVQLNVAKSNLKLVIANNEMLEDALKQNVLQSKEVGWHRTNLRGSSAESKDPRSSLERSQSLDIQNPTHQEPTTPPSASVATSNVSNTINALQDNRFFKFRFSTGYPTSLTRPTTPSAQNPTNSNVAHLTSPSMPSLSSVKSKEIEELAAELEREKAGRKKLKDEKAALEAELESLSQALFEEANKMVADERRIRADVEEELKELKTEKEALRNALRLVASENPTTNAAPGPPLPPQLEGTFVPVVGTSASHSRSSSQVGTKSRPQSLEIASTYPLPSSPSSGSDGFSPWHEESSQEEETGTNGKITLMPSIILSPEEESQPTPRYRALPSKQAEEPEDPFMEASPWADVPSSNPDVGRNPSTVPFVITTSMPALP